MLHTPTPFPAPGSKAMFDGLIWTVQRWNADNTATISRDGEGASLRRDALVTELVDPAIAEENIDLALSDHSEAAARIGLRIAHLLKDVNEVRLADLRRSLNEQARLGYCPQPADNIQIAGLLRRLGWKKQGMARVAIGATPLYARVRHA